MVERLRRNMDIMDTMDDKPRLPVVLLSIAADSNNSYQRVTAYASST
ncbi:MAG: hypothetical protein ACOX9E_03380 [Lentisphaeria bacterium]